MLVIYVKTCVSVIQKIHATLITLGVDISIVATTTATDRKLRQCCRCSDSYSTEVVNGQLCFTFMRPKTIAITLLMCVSAVNISADDKKPVVINPRPVSNGGEQGGGNKAPMQLPQVWIEDNVLTFDASCVGCMIEIVQDDVVVYTTFVDLNGEVTLPSTLSGTLQLVIHRGDQTFTGEFDL